MNPGTFVAKKFLFHKICQKKKTPGEHTQVKPGNIQVKPEIPLGDFPPKDILGLSPFGNISHVGNQINTISVGFFFNLPPSLVVEQAGESLRSSCRFPPPSGGIFQKDFLCHHLPTAEMSSRSSGFLTSDLLVLRKKKTPTPGKLQTKTFYPLQLST